MEQALALIPEDPEDATLQQILTDLDVVATVIQLDAHILGIEKYERLHAKFIHQKIIPG